MDRKITSENLYLLLPGKASSFARIYINKRGGSVLDALRAYYHSERKKKRNIGTMARLRFMRISRKVNGFCKKGRQYC